MVDPHREIQALVDNFVADLSALAKRIAIEQIKTAFSTGAKFVPAVSVTSLPTPRTARTARTARTGRARRGQGEIEALRTRLLDAIAEQPGRRTEDLNAVLGTKTAQIAQLLRRLVADHQVRTEGARRGTRYYIAAPPEAHNGRRGASEAAAAADDGSAQSRSA